MKVNLQSIDQTQFYVNERILNGEMVYLVIPKVIGTNWTRENKVFRSSVWDSNGELISAGFPKFTNWGEKPEVFPLPKSLDDCKIVDKIDGSLLIVSKWKGQFVLRTRGTVDATELDNGHELEIFKQIILPKLQKTFPMETWGVSVLFEWVSPLQKIVLDYGDTPDWYLVGVVDHSNYYLHSQNTLDEFAKGIGVKRPTHYTFPTIDELLSDVEKWKGKEGVVVYSDNGQTLHKCKSRWYLYLHKMKSELSSIEKVLDVYFSIGRPSYKDFCKYLETTFDYELMIQCIPMISKICDASKEVNQIICGMNDFINIRLKSLPTRKLQADVVIQSYGKTNRANFIFFLLDGKSLTNDHFKKLYFQILKN